MEKVAREKVDELISRLKIVRVDKGLSVQNIVDMTEDAGDPVSFSTVKRVFTDPEPKVKWATLRSIANVVLGVGYDSPVPTDDTTEQVKALYSENAALKLVVETKGEMIATKDRSIEFLKHQLARQQRATAILAVSTGLLCVAMAIALVVDYLNRSIGFLWLN